MPNKIRKPVVGEKLFVVRSGRCQNFSKQYEEVVKVGRKYFWVRDASLWQNKMNIEGLTSGNYNFPVKAYWSEQEYRDEQAVIGWQAQFQEAFSHWSSKKFTLEQYRAAAEIFGLNEEGDNEE